MKKLLLLISVIFAISANAQNCSDLFISEYIEGPGNNNAIEIYNPTLEYDSLPDATYSGMGSHICDCLTPFTIWSEDFDNGIPSTWTNSIAPWVYRGPSTSPSQNTGSQGAYASAGAPIASATASRLYNI